MAFTATNVSVPASGNTPTLLFEPPAGCRTDLQIFCSDSIYLLDDSGQSTGSGFLFNGASPIVLSGLLDAVYAVSAGAATTAKLLASNIA